MSIDPEFLRKLRCPRTRAPLALLAADRLAALNAAIAAGRVSNLAGRRLDAPLAAALVAEGQGHAYPIVDEIPILTPEEAVELPA